MFDGFSRPFYWASLSRGDYRLPKEVWIGTVPPGTVHHGCQYLVAQYIPMHWVLSRLQRGLAMFTHHGIVSLASGFGSHRYRNRYFSVTLDLEV